MPRAATPTEYRIGVDENGLGARLGPMAVTAVLAKVSAQGHRTLSRRLPKAIRSDLDDSKRLVSHADVSLGEAWARTVFPEAESPEALLEQLLLEDRSTLRAPCPERVEAQCWSARGERFQADDATCRRLAGHLEALAQRGVQVVAVKTQVLCTKRLNLAREQGRNRFIADLHAMEDLVLNLRRAAASGVLAICGKVGGIADYGRFFGPLSGSLHAVIEQRRARSAYYFPRIGEVVFLRDADGQDALVMLASLVGKYVRELLMARIVRFHEPDAELRPASGYHDPVSQAFVDRTQLSRRDRGVPDECFERARDPDNAPDEVPAVSP